MIKSVHWLLTVLAVALLLTGCEKGSGSDIGPTAPGRAEAFVRGLVVDGDGKPLVAARVVPAGLTGGVTTGSSGRFILPGVSLQDRVLEVDGRYASADGTDRFGRLRFRLTGGVGEWPNRLVLPDLASGAEATLSVGITAAPTSLNPGTTTILIGTGTTLDLSGETGSFVLGAAHAGVADLPRPLAGTTGLPCATVPLTVDPPLVRFTPTAQLTMANSLGLSLGEQADLWRLDPDTGAWTAVGTGTVDGSNNLVSTDLPGGGVYVFAIQRPPAGGTTITGTVRDPDGDPVAAALVNGPEGSSTVTLADGTFSLGPVAASDDSGAARNVTLVVRAGGGWMPARATAPVTLSLTGDTAAGAIDLDTAPAATVQLVGVSRGGALPWVAGRGGSEYLARTGSLDQGGQLQWEDVPLGRFNSRFGFISGMQWFQGYSELDLLTRDGVYEVRTFVIETNPHVAYIDKVLLVRTVADNGGALPATLVLVGEDNSGVRTISDEYSQAWFYGFQGRQTVTAYREQEVGGVTRRAVTTMAGLNNDKVTLPLPFRSRSVGSAYSPFGELDVSLSAGGGTTGIRGRRRLTGWDVKEALLAGDDLDGSTPRRGTLVGTPAGRATLTAWEVDGSTVLTGVGVSRGLLVEAASRRGENLAIDLPASGTLVLSGVLTNRNAAIAAASFTYGLGFLWDGDEGVLIRRGLTPTVAGDDLQLPVPALTGDLDRAEYLVLAAGSATTGGFTYTQKVLARGGGSSQAATLLATPTITSPAPGSTVDPVNLTLDYSVPAGTTAVKIEAVWDIGSIQGRWNVWIHPDQAQFTFFTLPPDGFDFFPASGTPVEFTITCYRHEGSDLALYDTFNRFLGTVAFGEPGRLGVTALSSVAMTVTMQ